MTNVMAMYKSLARTPMQKLQYDQGEDRWLCTLMLMAGGRIEFEVKILENSRNFQKILESSGKFNNIKF